MQLLLWFQKAERDNTLASLLRSAMQSAKVNLNVPAHASSALILKVQTYAAIHHSRSPASAILHTRRS